MTPPLVINSDSITSKATPHCAARNPRDTDAWWVTWLPGVRLDRNQAITAMMIAAEQDQIDNETLDDLAGELGLSAGEARNRLQQQTLL